MDGIMWGFIIGLFVGAAFGAGMICLCVIARRADDAIDANRDAGNAGSAGMDVATERR